LTDRNAGAAVAALALIDTIWSVLKPVMVGALQNIDTERRARASKDFFSDSDNVAHLKADLQESEAFLDDEFALAQARSGGRAVASTAALLDSTQPYWQKAIAAAGTAQCRSALPRL